MHLCDKAHCKIHYLEDINVIHLDWGKHASKEEFIEACNLSLKVFSEKKSSKMIADNYKVTVIALENQNWLTETWFPEALKQGFRYSAVVVKMMHL